MHFYTTISQLCFFTLYWGQVNRILTGRGRMPFLRVSLWGLLFKKVMWKWRMTYAFPRAWTSRYATMLKSMAKWSARLVLHDAVVRCIFRDMWHSTDNLMCICYINTVENALYINTVGKMPIWSHHVENTLCVRKCKKSRQHSDFPGGHPPEYYPSLKLLNFTERTGYGVLSLRWPSTSH